MLMAVGYPAVKLPALLSIVRSEHVPNPGPVATACEGDAGALLLGEERVSWQVRRSTGFSDGAQLSLGYTRPALSVGCRSAIAVRVRVRRL
jgi:hypothetical protein